MRSFKIQGLVLLGLFTFVVAVGCGGEGVPSITDDIPEIGTLQQGLDAARTRVIKECSQAMTGNHDTYNVSTWPTVTILASYPYISADIGAWNLLKTNYSGYGYQGFFVSCMRYRSEGYLPAPYTACKLSTTTGYGSYEMPNYTCQGNCSTATKRRGGQCKPFANLVAYRSGIYQNANYGFKLLPSDEKISKLNGVNRPDNDPDMPKATYANVVEGDFLRRPSGHAVIVVKKISSTQKVIVLDSNWLGDADGDEVVGSHEMGFSPGLTLNHDLRNYRVLKCVYTGRC